MLIHNYGPAAKERYLRIYANIKDPDQPVHLRSLIGPSLFTYTI